MLKRLFIILLLLSFPILSCADEIYYSKPPLGSLIDWASPVAREIKGCWLMNEGGGNFFNLSNILVRQYTLQAYTGTLLRMNGDAYFDGSTVVGWYNPWKQYLTIGRFTTITCFVVNATGMRAALGSANNPYGDVAMGIYSAWDNPQVNSNVYGGTRLYDSSETTVLRKFYTVALTYAVNGLTNLYVKGSLKNSGAAGTGLTVSGGYNFTVGGHMTGEPQPSTFSRQFSGRVQYVYWYSRVLFPSDIASVSAQPYKIIKNNYRNFMYAGVFGGAPPAGYTSQVIMISN